MRRAAKRERKGLRVPSRHPTVFQAEAGKLITNARTATGTCWPPRRNSLVGRPIPFHFPLGSGAWPGDHTLTEDWMPITYSNPNSVMPSRNFVSLP